MSSRSESAAQTGLGWLLGSRLLLAGMSLGLAVTIDRIEGGSDRIGIWGIYWTVAAAFLATIVSGLMVPRTREPHRFSMLQVGIDVAIVTSLVYFSGVNESVFTFLYALVVLYGALFLDRHGVAYSAGLAAMGYGFVVFGNHFGWLPSLDEDAPRQSLGVIAAYWAFYVAALVGLGSLANALSGELRRTGAALDRRTVDLRRLRDLHLRTVESLGSGLLTIDEEGRVTSFNPEAERITGLPASAATGQHLVDLVPGVEAIFEIDPDGEDEQRDGQAGRHRIAYRKSPGEELYLGFAASKLLDEEGEARGHVVIFQDVTGVVSMERDLRRSERMAAVGEMAARMAHEIRNPLASISGSVQILKGASPQAEPPDESSKLMGIVVREVDRLNDLIGDFLLYSRPAKLRLERVQLSSLVEEVAKMSAGQTGDEVRVLLELDSAVEIMADAALMKSVVWNLWINAIQAIGGSGTLTARIRQFPGDLAQGHAPSDRKNEERLAGSMASSGWIGVLEIEDSGQGIAEDDLDMIFEPFFTTKTGGTGLGLATVQRIVEQHDGTIEASSKCGEGTTFRILLPCIGDAS